VHASQTGKALDGFLRRVREKEDPDCDQAATQRTFNGARFANPSAVKGLYRRKYFKRALQHALPAQQFGSH
jgi:hypothetical protein